MFAECYISCKNIRTYPRRRRVLRLHRWLHRRELYHISCITQIDTAVKNQTKYLYTEIFYITLDYITLHKFIAIVYRQRERPTPASWWSDIRKKKMIN